MKSLTKRDATVVPAPDPSLVNITKAKTSAKAKTSKSHTRVHKSSQPQDKVLYLGGRLPDNTTDLVKYLKHLGYMVRVTPRY